MSNITVEMLKELFPVKDVAPYGTCIVVPGDKFDPDWEDQLCAHGHKVFMQSLDGKAVTLVKPKEEDKKDPAASLVANLQSRAWSEDDDETLLKRMHELPGTIEQKCVQLAKEFKGRSPAAIHQKYVKLQRKLKKPKARPEKELVHPVKRWSDKDTELLIKLWNEQLRVPDMMAKFPGRTRHGIAMRIDVLQKAGRIRPRWKGGAGMKHKPEKDISAPKSTVKVKCHTCKGMRVAVESKWPDGGSVVVACLECGGRGWRPAESARTIDWEDDGSGGAQA